MKMTQCDDCGFEDIRMEDTPCPHCEDGTMVIPA
jgi:predicted Zn-ribbon and HTH transcriptional regulator